MHLTRWKKLVCRGTNIFCRAEMGYVELKGTQRALLLIAVVVLWKVTVEWVAQERREYATLHHSNPMHHLYLH